MTLVCFKLEEDAICKPSFGANLWGLNLHLCCSNFLHLWQRTSRVICFSRVELLTSDSDDQSRAKQVTSALCPLYNLHISHLSCLQSLLS